MAAATSAAPAQVVALANQLAKLGYWADWDAESAFAAAREKYPGVNELNVEQLKELFLQLGYDKAKEVPEEEEVEEKEEGAEEGEEAVEKPPPPPPEISKFAEATFQLLNTSGAETLSVFHIFGLMNICKNGFGEAAFRFALKCLDDDGSGALLEPTLWKAITMSSNGTLDAISRNHLRRAWRTADKANAGEGEGGEDAEAVEEGKGDEEGAPDASKPATDPAALRVVIDSFVEKVQEDDRLASLLMKEVPVPIEEPKPEDQENLPPVEDD